MSTDTGIEEYNSTCYGKAWEIVGVTFEGAAYCVECSGKVARRDYVTFMREHVPVFASDEFADMSCDSCLSTLPR